MSESECCPMAAAILGIPLCRGSPGPQQGEGRGAAGGVAGDCEQRAKPTCSGTWPVALRAPHCLGQSPAALGMQFGP